MHTFTRTHAYMQGARPSDVAHLLWSFAAEYKSWSQRIEVAPAHAVIAQFITRMAQQPQKHSVNDLCRALHSLQVWEVMCDDVRVCGVDIVAPGAQRERTVSRAALTACVESNV